MSPFAVIGGAIGGAVAPLPSPEEVEQAVGALENAAGELKTQEMLRQRVILRLTEVERYPDIVAIHATPVNVSAEVNTLIEVRVVEIFLKGRGINPPLRLQLRGVARAVQGRAAVRSRKVTAEGDAYTLEEWAADEAKRFKEQLTRELERLAEKLTENGLDEFARPKQEDVRRVRTGADMEGNVLALPSRHRSCCGRTR
jgi:hypothetical protein